VVDGIAGSGIGGSWGSDEALEKLAVGRCVWAGPTRAAFVNGVRGGACFEMRRGSYFECGVVRTDCQLSFVPDRWLYDSEQCSRSRDR
jgi:hypothetical protein